ncbi:MAG: hypothetical protein WA666_13325 [Nitrospirota bacterium]
MKGTVVEYNPKRGTCIVKDNSNEYSVLELLGHEVEVGDVISGNLHNLGSETVFNETQMEAMSVYIQDIHASLKVARSITY